MVWNAVSILECGLGRGHGRSVTLLGITWEFPKLKSTIEYSQITFAAVLNFHWFKGDVHISTVVHASPHPRMPLSPHSDIQACPYDHNVGSTPWCLQRESHSMGPTSWGPQCGAHAYTLTRFLAQLVAILGVKRMNWPRWVKVG